MASYSPKSQIAGIQSVMPATVTGERRVCSLVSAVDRAASGIFSRSLNIVLYYNNYKADHNGHDNIDSGWLVAGWIKESLGRTMAEHPMLSGRLRRRAAEEEGGGGMEVVSNDSGIRLVEARIPVSLSEFLELVKREEYTEAEAVFWKDIDEVDPQFSPLFYVQVTNFQCGGYSVGISCSLLLADLLLEADFLRKWADNHNTIIPKRDDEPPKKPIFYLPKLKQDTDYLSGLATSISVQNRSKPVIFCCEPMNLEPESCKKLASVCVEETEIQLGGKMGMSFTLFVKEPSDGDIKVEVCSRHEVMNGEKEVVCCGSWDELGFSDVGFWPGNRPVHSSCWVGSASDGLVFVAPSGSGVQQGKSLVKVIVAIPKEEI